MAKKWSEVTQSREYQMLSDSDKEAARNQYFESVIVPQIQDPNEVAIAKSEFDSQYGTGQKGNKPMFKADVNPAGSGLAPSSRPAPVNTPTIAQTNAANASYRASPQAIIDEQNYATASADWKKNQFQELPAPARAFIGAGSRVGAMGRGFGQIAAYTQGDEAYAQAMQREEEARKKDAYMQGDTAASVGKFAGDVVMMAAPLSKLGAVPKAAQYGYSGLLGGAYAGAQPIVEGESRSLNTAIGAGAGLLGQGASNRLAAWGKSAASKPATESQKVYDYARSIGIDLNPGQLADNAFIKRFSMMMDKMPLSGATARDANQQLAGNKKLLQLIGQEGDGLLTPARFAQAGDELGARFDKVFQNGTAYDTPFLRDLATLRKEASGYMDEPALRTVDTFIKRVKEQAGTGFIPPKTLQSLDQMARKASTGGGDRQQVAQELRGILHDNFSRNANADVRNSWGALRKQYADFKTIEPLVARNPEGGVPLQGLLGVVNATKRGKGLMARDKAGEIGELAKVGQRMRSPSTSGTVENTMAAGTGAGLLTNAPMTISGLLGGSIVSRIGNSGTAGLLLRNQNAGATRTALAPYVQPAAILAAPKPKKKKKTTKE